MLSEEAIKSRLAKVEARMHMLEVWNAKYLELERAANNSWRFSDYKRSIKYSKKAHDMIEEWDFWNSYRRALLFVLEVEDHYRSEY